MKIDVKICGLSTEETMTAALDAGASHVGLIFFEKSPRNVTLETARRLATMAAGRATSVAVTVDASNDRLDQIVANVAPAMLQLHGKEDVERVHEVKARYGLPVMKALSIASGEDIERVRTYKGVADRLLLDAKAPAGAVLPGGNGVAFDWRLLQTLDDDFDYMLSGGLNIDNVDQAIRATAARGLDVSSGVEKAPGQKDPAMIKAFLEAVGALVENERSPVSAA